MLMHVDNYNIYIQVSTWHLAGTTSYYSTIVLRSYDRSMIMPRVDNYPPLDHAYDRTNITKGDKDRTWDPGIPDPNI